MGSAQIKGTTLRLRLQFVRDRWGDRGIEAVLAKLDPQDASAVRTALPIGWYPLSLNALLDQTICHVLAGSNERVYEEMGAYSADAFAERIYDTYFEERSPERFLAVTRELYKNYYRNCGTRRNVVIAPGTVDLYVEGSPEVYVPNCRSNTGFIRRCLELLEVDGAACEELECGAATARGRGDCHARVTWNP